jgi:heterodisulfide reductase subunit A
MTSQGENKKKPRIGVYVCQCGSNIAATVDTEAVAEFAKNLDGVVLTRVNKYSCSDPGQNTIRNDIREHNLDHLPPHARKRRLESLFL